MESRTCPERLSRRSLRNCACRASNRTQWPPCPVGAVRFAERVSSIVTVQREWRSAAENRAMTSAARLVPWNVHDLRRTVATGLQRLGVRLEVTEAVLNHISGSRGGIAGVYQRHDWAAEKRAALDAWAAHVASVVEGRIAKQRRDLGALIWPCPSRRSYLKRRPTKTLACVAAQLVATGGQSHHGPHAKSGHSFSNSSFVLLLIDHDLNRPRND